MAKYGITLIRTIAAMALLSINQVFFDKINSFSCLLLDSDILENKPSWVYPHGRGVEESRLHKLHVTHKVPSSDDNGVTDLVLLTENLMNKLQNLYGIAPSTFA